MTTFALVHGAWHGAWCWDAVARVLDDDGHETVAVDLPCEDPAASFDDYADVVVRSLEGRSDDVVVVGHSLAGQTIPLVAARRPVRALVYVCALLPSPGCSLRQLIEEQPDMLLPDYRAGLELVDDQGTTRWCDDAVARQTFFADCDDDAARAAIERLRPQATAPYALPCSLTALPAVPATYVVCADDRLVNPEWSRLAAPAVAQRVVELPGGHSPFLSHPRDLVAVLTAATPPAP